MSASDARDTTQQRPDPGARFARQPSVPVRPAMPRATVVPAGGARLLGRAGMLPVIICALYLIGLSYPAHLRVVGAYFTETDFYGLYALDADRIAAGRVPENTFNPPGYPALLAVAFLLTGDHFTSGKWMSLGAAALTGLVAFHLFWRLFGYRSALLALPVLLLSGEFTKFSIQATTDIPFLLLCVAVMFVLTHDQLKGVSRAALAGALSGLAYLTRYNGVFLIPVSLVGLVAIPGPDTSASGRLKRTALYLLCFVTIVSPWLWLNYAHHGSPIYSTNYRDVAREFYGSSDGFGSFWDVLTRNPKQSLGHYVHRVGVTWWQTVGSSLVLLPVGPLAVVGIALSVARRRDPRVMLLLLSAALSLVLMALTHWEARYHFYLLVCYVGLAAYAIVATVDWLKDTRALPLATTQLILVLVVLWILIPSSVRAYGRIHGIVSRQPYELIGASEYLKRVSAGATIMAFKPHLAYLSNGRWIRLPGVRSVEELRTVVQQNGVDYLAYDRMGAKYIRALEALAHPDNDIPWLKPVYADRRAPLVIYAVERGQVEKGARR